MSITPNCSSRHFPELSPELDAALSNSSAARLLVVDRPHKIDDYTLFSDLSSSPNRLVRFLLAAVGDRQQKLVTVDDATYDLAPAEGTHRARFTLGREAATNQDDLQLMGLNHPLVQDELGCWRSVSPGGSRHRCVQRRRRAGAAFAVDG